jgi:hypothetical protein
LNYQTVVNKIFINPKKGFLTLTVKLKNRLSKMIRIIIYPSDVMLLTNKSERYARRAIENIKKSLNKEKHQLVTIKEYCHYFAFDVDVVIAVLSKYELNKAS